MTRKTTGIPGLDGMLQGGFPFPSAILVAGAAGTMKTPPAIANITKKKIEQYPPLRIVIDPITPMTDMLQWRGETREFMHELFAYLKAFECLTLVTSEMSYDDISHSQDSHK